MIFEVKLDYLSQTNLTTMRAATLVSCIHKFAHIIPILMKLHWLSV